MKPQTTNPCSEQAVSNRYTNACTHDMVVLLTVWYPEIWISCTVCALSYPLRSTAIGGISK